MKIKFREPKTDVIYFDIEECRNRFCEKCGIVENCVKCPLSMKNNGKELYCNLFCRDFPKEAAEIMGYEIIQDEDSDPVNHPSHYTGGKIECIEAIKEAISGLDGFEAFCTANAIKYLWRWKWKNGAQDLEKAIWYIKRLTAGESKKEKPFKEWTLKEAQEECIKQGNSCKNCKFNGGPGIACMIVNIPKYWPCLKEETENENN